MYIAFNFCIFKFIKINILLCFVRFFFLLKKNLVLYGAGMFEYPSFFFSVIFVVCIIALYFRVIAIKMAGSHIEVLFCFSLFISLKALCFFCALVNILRIWKVLNGAFCLMLHGFFLCPWSPVISLFYGNNFVLISVVSNNQ